MNLGLLVLPDRLSLHRAKLSASIHHSDLTPKALTWTSDVCHRLRSFTELSQPI